jgi:sugar lactone lactonase YvrE
VGPTDSSAGTRLSVGPAQKTADAATRTVKTQQGLSQNESSSHIDSSAQVSLPICNGDRPNLCNQFKELQMIRKPWTLTALLLVSLTTSRLTAQQYGPPATGNTSAILFVPATLNLVAGLNSAGYGGDGGPANSATTQLNFPEGIAYDTLGNLFISDSTNHVVRRIDHVTGDISTFAGQQANYGFYPTTGTAPALSAQLGYTLSGLTIDSSNNIYLSDATNGVIWKITSAGVISVFAGGGTSPTTCTGSTNSIGDGCVATAATLEAPEGLAFDASGNLFIADGHSFLVREVSGTTGKISTFAGNIGDGYGLGCPAALYTTATGPWTPTQAHLCFPYGVAFDSSGNFYIAESQHNVVRIVTKSTGDISTFAGGGSGTCATATDSMGDGCPVADSTLDYPADIYVDPAGRVYIGDDEGGDIRMVDNSGNISIVLGDNGELTKGSIGEPDTEEVLVKGSPVGSANGLDFFTMDPNGNIVATDADSAVVTSAGSAGAYYFPETAIFTTSTSTTAHAGSMFYPPYIQISNPSGVTLNFTGTPSITGPFGVAGGTCTFPGSLAPGASCTLIPSFTPTQGGSSGTLATGTIAIDSNAGSSPSVINLQGTGFGIPTISATVGPNLLTFSSPVGITSAAQQATLTNTGQTPIAIGSYQLTGVSASDFAVGSTTCPSGAATLGVGDSCTYGITFTPGNATTFAAGFQVCITTSNYGCINSVNLQGTGTGSVTLTNVAFGNVTVGQTSAVMSATLTNGSATGMTGVTPSIIGANPSDFALTTGANACGATLAGGANCSIYITFTPASPSSFSATLLVADSATASLQTATLTGTGTAAPAPVAALTPASVPFGNVTSGTTSAAMSLMLSNTGNAPLTITGISIAGANPSDFAIATGANACGATLAASASCSIYVTFTPASAASFTATLQVADNAVGSPQSSTLTGTGTAAPAPIASLTPASVPFGNANTGTTSAPMSLTLSNTGNATLNITGITIAGANPTDFAIATGANACGTTLAANVSCSIYVTFTPASAASFSATLSVADNAAGSPQSSTLTGTGTTPPAPIAALTPATVPFGSLTAGSTSAAMSATLSNTGNAALNITGITIVGANPTDFAIATGANACGSTLAASASCSIYVTFTPASASSFTATLQVADNAAGSPQTSTLTGTGTAPPAPVATLAPNPVAFASETIGATSATTTVTLTNSGNATLMITGITITGTNPTDFATTTGSNACDGAISAGASCNIYVTFTPSSGASFSATLSVADNAAGSPQTVALSGSGINPADFSVSASPASQTVLPGGSTTYAVAAASVGGTFTNPVALTVSGLPAGATGSFSLSSITPGSESATSTLTVQTGTGTQQTARNSAWPLAAPVLAAVGLFFIPGKRRRRWITLGTLLLASLGTLTALSGCGGGFSFVQPSQTYTLTITGASGDDTHSTTVQLTVQ